MDGEHGKIGVRTNVLRFPESVPKSPVEVEVEVPWGSGLGVDLRHPAEVAGPRVFAVNIVSVFSSPLQTTQLIVNRPAYTTTLYVSRAQPIPCSIPAHVHRQRRHHLGPRALGVPRHCVLGCILGLGLAGVLPKLQRGSVRPAREGRALRYRLGQARGRLGDRHARAVQGHAGRILRRNDASPGQVRLRGRQQRAPRQEEQTAHHAHLRQPAQHDLERPNECVAHSSR